MKWTIASAVCAALSACAVTPAPDALNAPPLIIKEVVVENSNPYEVEKVDMAVAKIGGHIKVNRILPFQQFKTEFQGRYYQRNPVSLTWTAFKQQRAAHGLMFPTNLAAQGPVSVFVTLQNGIAKTRAELYQGNP